MKHTLILFIIFSAFAQASEKEYNCEQINPGISPTPTMKLVDGSRETSKVEISYGLTSQNCMVGAMRDDLLLWYCSLPQLISNTEFSKLRPGLNVVLDITTGDATVYPFFLGGEEPKENKLSMLFNEGGTRFLCKENQQ